MKRGVFLSLIFLFFFALTLLGNTLRYAERAYPLYLVPYLSDDPITVRTLDLLYDSLVKLFFNAKRGDSDPKPYDEFLAVPNSLKLPRIGPSVDPEEAKTASIRLRRSVRWSNGRLMTPADVVFTIRDILRYDEITSIYKYIANVIRDVQVDGYKLKFRYYFSSQHIISTLDFWIVPYKVYRNPRIYVKYGRIVKRKLSVLGDKTLVTSGPYQLDKITSEGYEFLLRKNYYIPAPNKSYFDSISMKVIPDPASMIDKFLGKGLDMLVDISPRDAEILLKTSKSNIRWYSSLQNSFYYLCLNYQNGIDAFREKKFRQLLAKIIDREAIIKDIYSGKATIITGPFYPTFWGVDDRLKPRQYSKAAVIEMKKEYSKRIGRKLRFIYIGGDAIMEQITRKIAKYLKDAGIGVRTEGLPPEKFQESIRKGDFDMVVLEYRSTKDFVALSPLLLKNGVMNFGRYNEGSVYDRKLTLMLEELEGPESFQIPDIEKLEKYRELHRYLYDTLPYIWLWTSGKLLIVKNNIHFPFVDPARPFKNIIYWYSAGNE